MKNKLKVLFDSTPLSNANAVRGIGMYTKLLLEHLSQIPELELVKLGSSRAKTFDYDLIHYPYFDFFSPTLPMVSTKKTIVTIHDVIPLIFEKQYPPGMRGSLSLQYQRLALRSINAVITDSQTSKTDIGKHLGYPVHKIHPIYLAGNPEVKPETQATVLKVKKKYKLPKNYVLYVGDINYNKNLPSLIKAIKYLPEQIHLVMVGKNFTEQDIPEWYWITSQVELSNVAKKVHYVNSIPTNNFSDLSAIYNGALCYVQPSLYEGFGLPVLEAMQAKTPVVSCENSSLIEVGRGHAVFADCSAESLAEGIKLVNSWTNAKRKEVVTKAYAWATSFSWKKTAQETFEVYKSL